MEAEDISRDSVGSPRHLCTLLHLSFFDCQEHMGHMEKQEMEMETENGKLKWKLLHSSV